MGHTISCSCSCSYLSKKPALEWTEEELDKLEKHNIDEWLRIFTKREDQLAERQKQEHEKKMKEMKDKMEKEFQDRRVALQSNVEIKTRNCKFCFTELKHDIPDLVCIK